MEQVLLPQNEGARLLQAECERRGLSIRQAAAYVGIPTPTFQAIWYGRQRPSVVRRAELLGAFGVAVDAWDQEATTDLCSDARIPTRARALIAKLQKENEELREEVRDLRRQGAWPA